MGLKSHLASETSRTGPYALTRPHGRPSLSDTALVGIVAEGDVAEGEGIRITHVPSLSKDSSTEIQKIDATRKEVSTKERAAPEGK